MSLPRRGRGRAGPSAREHYDEELRSFCARIVEINSTLDFAVSSRGWCYLLENAGEISKGDFNDAQRLINNCGKTGVLPIDICATDERRAADGVEILYDSDIEAEADWIVERIDHSHEGYTPFSFWSGLDVYVEIAVEKMDLKNLFAPIAEEFHVPLMNVGG